MGFAATGFLIALLSLVIPVWLHLRRSKPAHAAPVASLLLLRAGEDPLKQQRTIKDWLLLAIRLGFLFVLILAFAQPVLRDVLAEPAASSAAPAMIVVDVSASMTPHLQEAVALARELLQGQAALVSAAAELIVLAAPDAEPQQRIVALSMLRGGAAALDFADLPARLSTLADSLGSSDQQMQIHLISDFQSSGIPSRFNSLVDGLRHPLTLHPVSTEALPNWWIESLSATQLSVRSASTSASEIAVRIVVDDQPVYSDTVAIPASGEVLVSLPELTDAAGPLRIAAYIEPPAIDALSADNVRYHVSRFTSQRQVAVTGNRVQQRYVRTALASGNAGHAVEDGASQLLIALDPNDAFAELETAVREGARALVFTGASGRAALAAGFAGITPVDVLELPERSRLNVVDAAHPLSAQLAQAHDVTVFRYQPVTTSAGQVVARLDNGDPWLVEIPLGQGLLLLITSSLDPRDSDFAASPVFVGFLASAMSYLADDFVTTSVDVGSVLRLPQRGVQVFDADGARLLSLAQSQGLGRLRLSQPGIYQLRSAVSGTAADGSGSASQRDYFAANVPLQESDLRLLAPDGLERWRRAMSAPAVSDPGSSETASSRHFDLPLARWLLIAALLLLIAESLRSNGLPMLLRRPEGV